MKRIRKFLIRSFALAMLAMLVVGGVLGGFGYKMYRDALAEQPLEEKVAEIRADPDYTTLAEIPEIYLNVVVAVEDHRFEQHFGIDLIAIGRAAWNNLTSWSLREGGSTITQQLAKNLYFTQEKSFVRKIAEMFMAFRLENTYTKDEILELYVNSKAARERMDAILPRMMEAAGVTEELKARDPMRWVGLMNTLKAQAEEVLFQELIYI